MKKRSSKVMSIITLLTYIIMITVNLLANMVPINGITTREVSDNYANLFAPAEITFAIWGVIYFLLLIYTIHQLFYRRENYVIEEMINNVNLFFSFSSIVNALWIFAWHYDYIFLTFVLMIAILICLIMINVIIHKAKLSPKNVMLIRLPFAVYFGWITVATIANVTTYLVSSGWDGFGVNESVWTIAVIILGAIIGVATTWYFKNVAYGLTIIWAYIGILIKHLSVDGFNKEYPGIIVVTIGIIMVMLVNLAFVFRKKMIPEVRY